MHESVLLVEDEEALRMTLGDRLRSEGYVVECATDGHEGFEKAMRRSFDLIILDVMLPGRNGFSVCRALRRAGLIVPILMLTALGRTQDTVTGLTLGADAYVTKPFNMQELLARVEALLRRAPPRPAIAAGSCEFGAIRVDLAGTEVTREGIVVNLSAREFQLLRYFIEHPGATLSREELLAEVWGHRERKLTRTVDWHVASLRQKLEEDPKQPKFFVTVHRLGYKFRPS